MLVLINPPPLLLVFHFHLIAKTSPFSFQNFENITEGIIKDLFKVAHSLKGHSFYDVTELRFR